jgi:hypothetical protein
MLLDDVVGDGDERLTVINVVVLICVMLMVDWWVWL